MQHVRIDSANKPKGFFYNRDPWGHGIALWVVALLLFIAPLAVSSLRHVRLDNEMENWLPEKDPSAVEYAWCREHFPEDETMILTWEGSTADDVRLPILVGQLLGKCDSDGVVRGGLPYVKSVIHPGNLIQKMHEFGIDQADAIERMNGTLVGYGRLKVRLTPAGREQAEVTQERIASAVKSKYGIDLQFYDPLSPWQPDDLQEAEFDRLSEEFAALSAETAPAEPFHFQEHDFQISWKGIGSDHQRREDVLDWMKSVTATNGQPLVEDCYQQAGSPIAVVVSLSDAGKVEKNAAIAAVRQAALDSMIPEETLIIGGGVVAGVELNNGVIKAAWNKAETNPLKKSVILLSGFVGIFFALVALKSFRLGALVIFVAYYSALIGVSLVPLTGGSMNMVLVVMPTLLMVLALSGAIHVANYWKHAVEENPKNAVAEATRMATQPCLMAGFTTSLGLISLMNSDLAPVRDFGFYSSIGCMLSVYMVLYGLPALLQMTPMKQMTAKEVNSKGWIQYGNIVYQHWVPIGMVSLVVPIVCTFGLMHFDVETKIIRYFPEESQVVKDYQSIEDNLAGISPIEIIVRFNSEARDQYGFLERMELVRDVENSLRQHPEVSGAVSLATFQPDRELPNASTSTRDKIFFNRRSNETEKRVKSGEIAEVSSFLAMNRIPEANGDELWRINAQAAVLSDADYNVLTQELDSRVRTALEGYQNVDHVVTGTVPLFLRAQTAVLESLIWSSLEAFVLITCVMVWLLKDPIAGLIAMLPNIMPVMAVFGLVAWFGHKIDIGTMVTASVAMGISVDGTLHLLAWFRDGLERGYTRRESIVKALAHCGPAMWQTAAAVGLGLLVLLPAELLLISKFGWLMAALIGAAFLGDMVVLPCLMVGPLGWLMERRVRKTLAKKAAKEQLEPQTAGVVPPHHFPLATEKAPERSSLNSSQEH